MAASRNKLKASVEGYLAELRRIRATGAGTEERSYYPALRDLLNSVGDTLRPKMFSVIELGQQGAGHPDLGFFAARQVSKGQPKQGQLPEGGVVEVKPVGDDAWLTADSAQVSRYWQLLPAGAGYQHPRLRAAGRGLAGQPGQAGDLQAGRLLRRLRDQAATPPRLRQQCGSRR